MMHVPQESAAEVILNCIQKLELYNKCKTIPVGEIRSFKNDVIQAIDWTYDLIHSSELEIAMQLLDLVVVLENKFEMKEILGDHLLSFAVNYNLAACHQIDATRYLEKALDSLARYLGLGNEYKKNSETHSPKKLIFSERDSSTEKTKKLRILVLIIRGFLQCGAIKSQSMNHNSALMNANLGKYFLKMFIFNVKEINKEYASRSNAIEMGILSENQGMESPYFSPMQQHPELKHLTKFSDSSLIKDFNKFSNEILNNDPTEKRYEENEENTDGKNLHSSKKNEKKFSGIILWKHNVDNNEKYFKREFEKRSRDLGVNFKMTTMWLKEFNIGDVMHIKATSYKKMINETEFDDYFNQNLVVETVLTYACCLFSIATENRFICQKELENEERLKSNRSETLGVVDQITKKASSNHFLRIYRLKSNPNFIESETFHFTAIEILCAFVEDCPLLNHLINSYQKNYFPDLETIKEEMNESWTSASTRRDSIKEGVMLKSITEYDYVKLIEEDSREDQKIISEESRSQIINMLDESRGKLGDSMSFKRSSLHSNLKSEDNLKKSIVFKSKGDILAELVDRDVLPDNCHKIDYNFEENLRFSIDKEEKSIFKKSTHVCSNSPQSNHRLTDSFNRIERQKDMMMNSPLNFETEIKFQKMTSKKIKMKSIDAYIQTSEKKEIMEEKHVIKVPQITKSPLPVPSQVKVISNENQNIATTLRKKSEHLRRRTREKENRKGANTSRSRKSASRSRLSSSRSRLSQTSKLLSYDILKSGVVKPPYKYKNDNTMLKKLVKHTMLNKKKLSDYNFKGRSNFYESLKYKSKANLALKNVNFKKKKRAEATPRVMSLIRKNFLSKSQRGNSYERKGSMSRKSGKSVKRKKRSRSKRQRKLTYSGVPTGFTRSLITRSYRELARKRIFKEKTRSLSKRLKARTKSTISQRMNSRSSASKNLFNKRKISQNDSNSIRIHSANLMDTIQSSSKKKPNIPKLNAGMPQNRQFKDLITKMYQQERSPSFGKNDYNIPQTARCGQNRTSKKKHRKTSSRICASNNKSKRKGSRLLGGSRTKRKGGKSKGKGKCSVDLRSKKKSIVNKPLNLNFINSHKNHFKTSNLTFKNFGSGNLSKKKIKDLNFKNILKRKKMASPDLRKNKLRQKSRGNSKQLSSSKKKNESNVFKNSYLISHLQKIQNKKFNNY